MLGVVSTIGSLFDVAATSIANSSLAELLAPSETESAVLLYVLAAIGGLVAIAILAFGALKIEGYVKKLRDSGSDPELSLGSTVALAVGWLLGLAVLIGLALAPGIAAPYLLGGTNLGFLVVLAALGLASVLAAIVTAAKALFVLSAPTTSTTSASGSNSFLASALDTLSTPGLFAISFFGLAHSTSLLLLTATFVPLLFAIPAAATFSPLLAPLFTPSASAYVTIATAISGSPISDALTSNESLAGLSLLFALIGALTCAAATILGIKSLLEQLHLPGRALVLCCAACGALVLDAILTLTLKGPALSDTLALEFFLVAAGVFGGIGCFTALTMALMNRVMPSKSTPSASAESGWQLDDAVVPAMVTVSTVFSAALIIGVCTASGTSLTFLGFSASVPLVCTLATVGLCTILAVLVLGLTFAAARTKVHPYTTLKDDTVGAAPPPPAASSKEVKSPPKGSPPKGSPPKPMESASVPPPPTTTKMAVLSKNTPVSKSFKSVPADKKEAELYKRLRKTLFDNFPYDVFVEWDTDNTGTIDKEELFKAVNEYLGFQIERKITDELYDRFDVDASGRLDYQELYRKLAMAEGKPGKPSFMTSARAAASRVIKRK